MGLPEHMSLMDLLYRNPAPEPWREGDGIPWNEPAFSERMLKEHLSQEHDAASRRSEIIERHVGWIHGSLLGGRPTRILDLGCGPGLYSSRLARLGHQCLGIDYSPASIAYARQAAEGLTCTYVHADIRGADYGEGFGLAMLIFGEFNVFAPTDAHTILAKAHRALAPGGLLLLEPHTYVAVEEIGHERASWYSAESGLFSERPHLYLEEARWDEARRAATTRYYIVDAESGQVTRYAGGMQAYTDEEYRALLAECGFGEVAFYPSLAGDEATAQPGLFALVARKVCE